MASWCNYSQSSYAIIDAINEISRSMSFKQTSSPCEPI